MRWDRPAIVPPRDTPISIPTTLADLPGRLVRDAAFAPILAKLREGSSAAVDGAWGSAAPLAAAAVATQAPSMTLVCVSRLDEVDDWAADLEQFLGQPPSVFPAWESVDHEASDPVFARRLQTLGAISRGAAGVVVAPLPALMQPVPSAAAIAEGSRELAVGEEIDIDQWTTWLEQHGFHQTPAVAERAEYTLHGGILDIFPLDAVDPVRVELFGDEIESIRRFDAESQRKIESLDQVDILAAAPPLDAKTGENVLDRLPEDAWIVLPELGEFQQEGRDFLRRLPDARGLFTFDATMRRLTTHPTVTVAALAAASFEQTCHLQVESIERFSRPKTEIAVELGETIGQSETLLLACHNEGERTRLSELLDDAGLGERLQLTLGAVTRGFRWVTEKLVVLGDHELMGRPDVRRAPAKKRADESRAIDSFLDLKEGDLVVHLAHGIGRFRGMELVRQDDGRREEHLRLEFRDGVEIFVPASLIHLVQKYVGTAKKNAAGLGVKLSKVGGTAWGKQKEKVGEAVQDMATDMLRLQAIRRHRKGRPCEPITELEREFAAAFPYVYTPDQNAAIAAIDDDMQNEQPMDRLICGDVGFGKTEVAMRAAFKAVANGRQAAVLVPTTVLAEQHERSFGERMAEFPVNVASLSRFKTRKQQRETVEGLKTGEVDIVIGTHRLVSKDVAFKDLGLLVIDEEQRFGVDVKEKLKRMRLDVDVLTLTATPIPRTLHMSLLGIRDISNLTTPPRDRVPIETRVVRFDGEMIRAAIVRELNRGGQVYFVHNRVHNIDDIAERLHQLVPEASYVIGHGQMKESDLENAMVTFVSRQADVLVATTIIESGLDIPTANTMFVHQADRYGLADLHQLRGRVGRYKHRAYCYLVLEPQTVVAGDAQKRLKAIEEYSELGAGFRIAMRDLEIRGAGNLLGNEQSGHIATVGYELYCQLLENAVRHIKKQPPRTFPHVAIDLPVEAYLPPNYVPPGRQKIDIYRRLSSLESTTALAELAAELRDRFGPVPEEATRLLRLRELELAVFPFGVKSMRLDADDIELIYDDAQKIHILGGQHGRDFRVVDSRRAYLRLPHTLDPDDGVAVLDWVLAALGQASESKAA